LTLLVLSLSAGAWLNARPKAPAGPVAALFPPWWRARDAFDGAAAAGAAIVRTGAWPTLLVVTSPDPRLEAHLRAAGALLLLDPRALGGCLAGA
jgi:hypothetical protein